MIHCVQRIRKKGVFKAMQKLGVLEVLIEENVFDSVRPVAVVASAPVGALVPALVEELRLPQTDVRGKQRVYVLRTLRDGSILPDSRSLLASGVRQGERLALNSYVIDGSVAMMARDSAQNHYRDPQFHASETMVDFNKLLQYPQADRRERENLMPLLMPSDVENSNRVTPTMSSGFALGRDTDAHVQSVAQPIVGKRGWTRRAFLTVGGIALGAGGLGLGYAAYKGLLHGATSPMVTHQVPVGIAPQKSFMPTKATSVFTFTQHQQIVRSVSWSPNGSLLASGADDSQLYLWGINGAVQQKMQFPASVRALAWSPEGQRLVVGSANQVIFMNATNGMVLARSTRHTGVVSSVSWTPHNQMQVVSGAVDMRAVVWNSTNYQSQYIFTRHTTPIEVVSWAADGQMIASSTHEGIIRVWNATNGQEAHGYYMDGQAPIRALAFAPSGMQLAAGGDDGIVRVWNGVNCQKQTNGQFGPQCMDVPQRFHVSTSAIRTVAWSPDARFLASGGNDGMLAIWYPAQQQPPLFTAQQNGSVHSITWSPDGKQLAVAAGNTVAVMKLV